MTAAVPVTTASPPVAPHTLNLFVQPNRLTRQLGQAVTFYCGILPVGGGTLPAGLWNSLTWVGPKMQTVPTWPAE